MGGFTEYRPIAVPVITYVTDFGVSSEGLNDGVRSIRKKLGRHKLSI